MPIKLVVIAAVVFLMPLLSIAQENRTKWEVFGTAGYGRAYDDEGNIGSGLDLGGGFGYRITPKVGVEGSFNWFSHTREFGGSPVRFEGTAVSGAANVVYHFSESKVQPFVTGGIGALQHEDRSTGLGQVGPPRTKSGFSYNFGGGVKIFLTKRVALRPEGRVLISNLGSGPGIEPPFSTFRGSVGIGYHW